VRLRSQQLRKLFGRSRGWLVWLIAFSKERREAWGQRTQDGEGGFDSARKYEDDKSKTALNENVLAGDMRYRD
jgi:hypothetical protein